MITSKADNFSGLLLVSIVLIITLSACSRQNWYQGAQSAKEAHCMKEPVSEYEDCMQQSSENYDEYNKNREALIEENATTNSTTID